MERRKFLELAFEGAVLSALILWAAVTAPQVAPQGEAR